MKLALAALLFMATVGSAWAGCANYPEDGPPPKVTTCYKGKCEATTMTVECGSVWDIFHLFSNGFEVGGHMDEATKKVTTTVTRNKRPMNAAEFCFKDDRYSYDGCDTPVG